MAMSLGYLTDEDLLDQSHLPVMYLMACALSDGLMSCLSIGWGVSVEFCWCTFTDHITEEEEFTPEEIASVPPGDGVFFECDGLPSVLLTYDELYYYMKLYTDRYLANNPDKKEKFESYLATYRKNFLNSPE